MRPTLFICFIILSMSFSGMAQSGMDYLYGGIFLSGLEGDSKNLTFHRNSVEKSANKAAQSPISLTNGSIDWGSGYDHAATLGFFCKFEDIINTKSKLNFNLGLTAD